MFTKPFITRSITKITIAKRFQSNVPSIPPQLLELKVGKIQQIKDHPEADKLYISQVLLNNDKDDSITNDSITICSGLRNHLTKEELLDQKVVIVTNLKPSKMKGIKSEAMLLAGERVIDDKTTVKLVKPPSLSPIGRRLVWLDESSVARDLEKPKRINNIKKLMTIVDGLKTDENNTVYYKSDDKVYYLTDSELENILEINNDFVAHVDNLPNAIVR